MAYNYDTLYKSTPDALGAPTPVFVDFFKTNRTAPLDVLDVGCGQGRDALFIARLGHRVVGVDLSPNGIRDLQNAARAETLHITGIAADIVTFETEQMFDVIVIDRTLHMLTPQDQSDVLARLIAQVRPQGWVLIEDEKSNIQRFKDVLSAGERSWSTEKTKGGTLFVRRT